MSKRPSTKVGWEKILAPLRPTAKARSRQIFELLKQWVIADDVDEKSACAYLQLLIRTQALVKVNGLLTIPELGDASYLPDGKLGSALRVRAIWAIDHVSGLRFLEEITKGHGARGGGGPGSGSRPQEQEKTLDQLREDAARKRGVSHGRMKQLEELARQSIALLDSRCATYCKCIIGALIRKEMEKSQDLSSRLAKLMKVKTLAELEQDRIEQDGNPPHMPPIVRLCGNLYMAALAAGHTTRKAQYQWLQANSEYADDVPKRLVNYERHVRKYLEITRGKKAPGRRPSGRSIQRPPPKRGDANWNDDN